MRLRTLGNLQVEASSFKRPKPLLLLSYLAVEGVKERRYLSQLFWPNTSNPSHSLSKAVYRLKQGLKQDLEHLDVQAGTDDVLQSDEQSISTTIAVDVLELLDALEKNDLTLAVELYQGEFLSSFNTLDLGEELEQWVFQTRDYIAKRIQQAYLSLSEQQWSLERNPNSKKSFNELSKDTALSSLQYAEKAYKVLDSSLSTPDAIETLYKQLKLNNSPLAETLQKEVEEFGIVLTDLYKDDLESLSNVDDINTASDIALETELNDIEVGTEFEASKKQKNVNVQSLVSIDNQYFTKFIGRDKEVSEVISLFKDEQVRLLSLIGIGGSGKTRLAIEIAKQTAQDETLSMAIQEHYFVNIQGVKTQEAARLLFAETIGLEPDINDDLVKQITGHIGQRSLVVILDGFEYLSRDAGSLPELLYRCPNLYLIVTSRERLNLPEEWILQIRGLTYQLETEADLQDLTATSFSEKTFEAFDLEQLERWQDVDAVRFFAERAKQADVRFNLEDNLEGVIELCVLVAGLPLALELAATWVRHMPCKQIVAEVRQSLDLLYRDSQYSQDHHTSIRAVFEHSWQLLNLREETIFASLAIFKQGFRREAALKVADASIVQLAVFLDKSLLSLDASGRYHCHPLLEQFMSEKLVELEIDKSALEAKHAAFYSDYLLNLQTEFHKDIQTVVRFREDVANFSTAWYKIVEQEDFILLQSLLPAFKVFFEHLHRYNDAIEPINKAVQQLFRSFDSDWAAAHPALLSFRLGQAWAYCSSDYRQAETYAKEAIELAAKHDDDLAKGLALRLLGEIALEQKGDKVQAKAHFDQALALAQRIGDIELSARCWRYLAAIAVSNGNNEAALDFQRTALQQFENLGDKVGIADCRCEVGHLLVLAKRADEAEIHLLESLKLSKELDFKLGIVNSLCFLGDVAYERKQYSKAEDYYNDSLELSEEIHDYYGVAGGYMDLATVAAAEKNASKASQYFYQALEKAVSLNVKPLQLSILTHIAILKLEFSDSDDSVKYAVEMLQFIEVQDETDQYDKDLIKEQFETYKDKCKNLLKKPTTDQSLTDWCSKAMQDLKDYNHQPTFELVV